MLIPRGSSRLLLAAILLAAASPAGAAIETYISLGDSLAFGYSTYENFLANVPTFADQGFAKVYADGIADRQGGRRPQVINLGIPYETTQSFFSGGQDATVANANYSLSYLPPYPSQSTVFDTQAALQPADVVSIELGSNDLFALAADPAFQASSDQGLLLAQALAATAGRYQALLQDVQTRLPQAEILVLGTYNPFTIVPNSPFAPLASIAIPALNNTLQGLATAFGARYIDVFGAFVGHEADYTLIQQIDSSSGQPNVHPSAQGYQVIGNLMLAQTTALVPEPGAFVLAGMGGLILLGAVRGRRPSAA